MCEYAYCIEIPVTVEEGDGIEVVNVECVQIEEVEVEGLRDDGLDSQSSGDSDGAPHVVTVGLLKAKGECGMGVEVQADLSYILVAKCADTKGELEKQMSLAEHWKSSMLTVRTR